MKKFVSSLIAGFELIREAAADAITTLVQPLGRKEDPDRQKTYTVRVAGRAVAELADGI